MAIVGAGAMGRGIAQLLAQAGHAVRLFDQAPGQARDAVDFAAGMIRRQADKGQVPSAEAAAAIDRLAVVERLEDLAGTDLMIEAIVERLEAKRQLFAAAEAVLGPDAILATNTSSLSVTAIQAGLARPGRVAGLHFFNPVPLMRVVEVVPGELTDPSATDTLVALVSGTGHRPVVCRDAPGFLVNHAGRGLPTEGLRCLAEGVADAATIDRVLREQAGFRMGPFELMDLTGLDVSWPVMEQIYHQFQQEPRFRPQWRAAQRHAAGLFGRKTGRGWYHYDSDKRVDPPEPPPPAARPRAVWCADADLTARVGALGQPVESGPTPSATALILLAPWGADASRTAARMGVDPARTVAVDPLFADAKRVVLMTTVATEPAFRDQAHGLFAASGRAVSVIADSSGFIAQRVAATIVNIACDIAQAGIAAPADIDPAARLGLGYPEGPLALGDRVGAARVAAILDAIHVDTGDPRYRVSPWLARRAALGLPLAAAG
jgi:3-hydroxybutyryl-CoA dehydrogenase